VRAGEESGQRVVFTLALVSGVGGGGSEVLLELVLL
jgi:hypothetical protein